MEKTTLLGFLAIILLFGCILPESNVKTIEISGVGQTQEISSETPVRLVVSGVNNAITVKEGTSVQEIDVSGVDVKIKLPYGAAPKITDTGVRTQITYN